MKAFCSLIASGGGEGAATGLGLGAGVGMGAGMAGLITQMMQQSGQQQGGQAAPAAVPAVMTVAEAATYLKVSEQDVLGLIESGDLKARQIGSQHRISRAAIDAFLQG